MAEKSMATFIEEYQTGALLFIFSVAIGVALLLGVEPILPSQSLVSVVVFLTGAIGGFAVLSYLLYGR